MVLDGFLVSFSGILFQWVEFKGGVNESIHPSQMKLQGAQGVLDGQEIGYQGRGGGCLNVKSKCYGGMG